MNILFKKRKQKAYDDERLDQVVQVLLASHQEADGAARVHLLERDRLQGGATERGPLFAAGVLVGRRHGY